MEEENVRSVWMNIEGSYKEKKTTSRKAVMTKCSNRTSSINSVRTRRTISTLSVISWAKEYSKRKMK